MNKEIAIIDYNSKEVLETLKATVAKDATPAEFAMFVEFAKSTGLNPYKKELWFIKDGQGRVQMMTGINGFFAIANSHPQFDGLECDVELDKGGHPVKATAKAYRKDRRIPSVGIAIMAESKRSSPVWQQQPSVMLSKVAKARALREAFPQELNGLYTDDEYTPEKVTPVAQIVIAPKKDEKEQTPTRYAFPDEVLTKERREFLDKVRADFDERTNTWLAPMNLGPKLEPYRYIEKSQPIEVGTQDELNIGLEG